MAFTVTVDSDTVPAVLRLTGELDMAAVETLNARIDALVAAGRYHVLTDLSGLTFCDSTGLSAFIRGDNKCTEHGGWLRVTGQHGHVARVLTVIGLTEVLQYRPAQHVPTP